MHVEPTDRDAGTRRRREAGPERPGAEGAESGNVEPTDRDAGTLRRREAGPERPGAEGAKSGNVEPSELAAELDEREQAAHALIAQHLEQHVANEPYIQTVEYDSELTRWYVRFGCDARDATTIYFDLHQRTLRYEVYFLPDPPANHLELYRFLLQRNHGMYGARFSIGPDGDVYLVGRVALEHLDVAELDRIIGVLYELVDTWFQPAVRIAFRRGS